MKIISSLVLSFLASIAYANTLSVTVLSVKDNKSLGTVTFSDSQYGLLIKPHLSKLPPGNHGFHLHQNPSCANEGMAAGGHYDPQKTNTHKGPYADGHLGDLPILSVDSSGKASIPILAPRLKVDDIKGLSLMIHAGGDTYSDQPKLGGGGARIACGLTEGQ